MPINNPNADEILFQRGLRIFSQRGGPLPNNRMRYCGPEEQYMVMGDVKDPVRGKFTPVRVHDPRQRGAYRLVGMQTSMPDLTSNTVSFTRRHGGISWIAGDLTCPNNYYELAGECRRPDDFNFGWSDFMTIYSYGMADDRTYKARASLSDDNMMMDDVNHIYAAVYDIGGMSFTDNITPTKREAIDAVYGSTVNCGNCGPLDDGTQRIYVLCKSSGAGSPGIPAEVVYTTNHGQSWAAVNITGLAGTQDPTGIDVVGYFLVVIDTLGGGYYYAPINPLTGVPGSWTNVTAGFQAGGAPTDIFVVSADEIYFCGNGGYIYRSTDITAGVVAISSASATSVNLTRIDGFEDTLVSVGASGVVIKSLNHGQTWATVTTFPTSNTLRGVDVRDTYRFWVVGGGGGVWFTMDGGETWANPQSSFQQAQLMDDVVFATDEIGYIIGRAPTLTSARLWTTSNGGQSWVASNVQPGNPRILNFPTYSRSNRIAVPQFTEPGVISNQLVLAGLNADGTNGNIILGLANVR